MVLEKISERIYADMDGTNGGNYGAIILDNEIVFVDSGMFHHLTLEARNLLEEKHHLHINKMILTHYHGDHVWGAQGLGDITILSSTQTQKLCIDSLKDNWSDSEIQKRAEESKEIRPELWKAVQTLEIKLPDLIFDDRIQIGQNQEISVQHVGGHTLGSSIVVYEPENVCFCGDIIFNKSYPYAGDPGCIPDQWISVLEEMERANYEKIIPGHGGLCDNEEVHVYIDFLKALRSAVKDGLERGLTEEEFIQKGMTPDYYKKDAGKRAMSSIKRWYEYYKS